jgi:hypothetical protein
VRGVGLRAGLYEVGPADRAVRFVKDATAYEEIQNEMQFVVVDGPPVSGERERVFAEPFSRLCHLLFSYPISDDKGALSPHARRVLAWIYGLGEGDT